MDHKNGLQTPVLFTIFNRPNHTKQVFDIIRKQKPAFLYIAADGPRIGNVNEIDRCELSRQIVLEAIDWECDLKVLLREENLGCGKAMSEAITWFFDNVEEGIILEDDCLPDASFFSFCEALLARYRNDNQIMHIGGSNFQHQKVNGTYSYYFSNYIHIWGWATWRRAWNAYEFNISDAYDSELQYLLRSKFNNSIEREYWANAFANIAHHSIDTWDIQWNYSIFKKAGIGITPSVNLVANIGFDADATHTTVQSKEITDRIVGEISIIKHPNKIKVFKAADRYSFKTQFQHGDTHYNRIKFKVGKLFPLVKRLYLYASAADGMISNPKK